MRCAVFHAPECGAPFFMPTGGLKAIRGLEVMKDKKDNGWEYLARTGPIEGYVAEFRCTNCGFVTDIYPPVNVFKELNQYAGTA